MAVVEHNYSYAHASALQAVPNGQVLSLAADAGPAPEEQSQFLEAQALFPQITARSLRAVSEIVGSRFYVPPSMLARILREADPVATVSPGAVRFEGFSACCSAYIRLDLGDGALEVSQRRTGTTNVDFGPELLGALATVGKDTSLGLTIGADAVGVVRDERTIIEKKVPLPLRWIKGFAEVQVILAGMEPTFRLSRVAAQRFLRQLPRSKSGQLQYVAEVAGQARLSARPVDDAVPLRGAERLRVFETLVALSDGLVVHVNKSTGATTWALDFGAQSLSLVLNVDPWRGFSGDGGLLSQVATSDGSHAAAIRAQLNWQDHIDEATLADATGLTAQDVRGGLAELAAAGLVGFDLLRGGYFHRVLPFDMDKIANLNPRLKAARALLDKGAVRTLSDGAEVQSDGVTHRVRVEDDGWRCTCPWFAKNGGQRGPCKHALAVEMYLECDK